MRRLAHPVTLAEICQAVGGQIKPEHGQTRISALATLVSAGSEDLSFLTDSRYRQAAGATGARAALITPDNQNSLPDACIPVLVSDAYLAFATAAQFFSERLDQELPADAAAAGIHPQASVSPGASLGERVTVAAGAVVQAGATVGDDCIIGANSVVGPRAVLGSRIVLHANVSVYPDVSIGSDCVIHSNTVLGSDGFGFARQGQGWAKIPQLGGLRIGERCEIGSNTSLDRGALDDTVVGDDCVVDNLVQIAHNVQIGAGSAIAGCVGISGSVKIGRRCLIGGGVGFNGHIEVCDDVMISPMTFVTKSIRESGFYSGTFPIMPNKQWERAAASIRQLPDMRSKLRELEKLSREIQ